MNLLNYIDWFDGLTVVTWFLSSGATALQGFGRQSGCRRSANLVPTFADRGVSRGQRNGSPRPLISVYRTCIATYFIQVAPQLTSRGWVYPVPDPLPLRKSGSAGNRTRDLCICSQKPWPLDHRGGLQYTYLIIYRSILPFFFRKSCRLWYNVENYCRVGKATHNNMAHAHCTLDA